ncbi:unnamed protein product [Amoebophrya sp. A25]|nr:unnamed protein product [Amoebophrya sp. A25]|eukprot:GSA25T00019914001.1
MVACISVFGRVRGSVSFLARDGSSRREGQFKEPDSLLRLGLESCAKLLEIISLG